MARTRALAKSAVKTLAVLIVVLLAIYSLRQPLLSGRITAEIASVLSAELSAKVAVATIGGDWFNTVEVAGIEIEGGRGPIRSLHGGTARAEIDLFGLIGGDLEAVRSVRVEARSCRIGIPDGSSTSSGESQPLDPRPLFELAAKLCPNGAKLYIEQLEFGRRAGPLTLSVPPVSNQDRELMLTYPGVQVSAAVARAADRVVVTGRLDDPGGVAQELGLDNRIEGGRLTLDLEVTTTRVSGVGRVAGARVAGRSIHKATFDVTVRKDRIELPLLDLQLPGLTARGKDFVIPYERDKPTAKALDGELVLEIADLNPYTEFLPAEVREWMPITGSLSGRLSDRAIDLQNLRLVTRGVEITATSGALPFDTDALTGVGFKVRTLSPQTIDIGPLGKLGAEGELEGELTGNLHQPKLEASVVLAVTTEFLTPKLRVTARIGFDKELKIENLEIQGLGKQALVGSGFVLPARGTNDERLRFELEGDIAPQMFRLAGRVDDRVYQQLIRISNSPVKAAVELSLPETGGPVGRITLALPEIGLDNTRELAFHTAVWLDGDRGLRIDEFELERRGGTKLLSVTGALPFEATGMIDFRVHANQIPLELVARYGAVSLATGSVDAGLTLRGPALDPDVAIRVDARLEKPFEEMPALWPTELGQAPSGAHNVRVRISGKPSALSFDELRIEGSDKLLDITAKGEVPVSVKLGPEPVFVVRTVDSPLTGSVAARRLTPGNIGIAGSLDASFVIGNKGLEVQNLVFRAGSSQVLGSLRARFEPAELCAGNVKISDVPIGGSLDLTRLELATLPAQQLGLHTLSGRLDGNMRISGTLTKPDPSANLTLREVEVKAGSMPRMEQIAADVRLDGQRIEINRLNGTIGSGDFTASGNLTAAHGDLLTAFKSARLDLAITGTDVLVARTSEIRARCNLRVTVTGTPEDIRVHGNIGLVSGKYAKRRSALPDLTLKGASQVDTSFSPFRWASPLGQRVTFEQITVETRSPFRVRTGLFDCDLTGQFKLGGPGPKPYIVGNMSGSKGILRLPGSRLKITSISFRSDPADPYRPQIQLSAEGMRVGYRIYLDVIGPVHSPEIRLTSTPSLPAEDLLVLVTTGYTPKHLSSQSDSANLQLVGTFVIQELISAFSSGETSDDTSSFADQITIESGREIGPSGLESLRAEVGLTDNFYLVFERDVYGDYNLRPGFRIRF